MKRLILFFITLLCLAANSQAQEQTEQKENLDSLKISLLTCGSYDEVWTLYGHSALRIQDLTTGRDFAVNYGLFDFNQPMFVWRFMFGKCDYMMGFVPFESFMREFSSRNASVFQQEINLTSEEKASVMKALYINSQPENCYYRYNFYFDNCATRPRDIILNNIPDRIIYNNVIDSTKTFRDLIHANNGQKPWCRFGNDLLLGVNSDKATNRLDQQFLPANLQRDFANAEFVDANGNKRPAVLSSEWILPDNATYSKEFPLNPTQTAWAIFALFMAITALEIGKKKHWRIFDIFWMSAYGILGVILFLMIFSEHPTVSLNLQILTFCPLNIFFIWRVIPELKGKKPALFLRAYSILLILSIISALTLQQYAEGILILTLAAFLRLFVLQTILIKRK